MKKIELLLPVGNQETLEAAVENGADAVYLGIDRFNARRRANNFTLGEMGKVVSYCHKNGVRVYVTMNILVKNSEINEFFDTIKDLYLAGVDAVIIQELSFLPIIKENFPSLEVHISTQAAVSNTYFYDLIKLADKIVLPREFSKEEISEFIIKTKLPTEVFVQGALCFSYSGKCLFSSVIGGRSGNRGLCAQPCRRKYNGKYLLSMKDLSLVKAIPELIEMGVSSLKIEGRLRSAKYVTASAKMYRTAIDSYYLGKFEVDEELFKEMKLAFNREFTWGYYAKHKDLVSDERPMGRGLYLGEINKKGLIKLEEEVSIGDGLGIWLPNKVDGAVLRKIEIEGSSVENAQKGELVKLYIHAASGTKIYKTSSVKESKEISFEKNQSILLTKRKEIKIRLPKITEKESSGDEFLVKVYSYADAKAALKFTNKVFYDIFAENFDTKFCAYIPRLLNDKDVEKAIALVEKKNIKIVLVGDLGAYCQLRKNKSLQIYLDYSNNVFNDISLKYLDNFVAIISPELSFKELQQFHNRDFAVFVHGKVVMMNTKYEHLPAKLKDEKSYIFPVRKEHKYYQILNSKEQGWFELIKELKKAGINKFFFDLDHNVEKTLMAYKDVLVGKEITVHKFNFTKGHWDKGVE
ncbi:hypothetical protein COY27_06515 [Candidatus Woesearchaeota archaeon CG_4_10_14_0_2_um_filter_33_13]|nr:MAG: hypothetical protein COY27_06515 [Candidatus Woesearchaeota archaeon CG_4_10_14_0_2_um_filter_33_13]